MGRRRTANEIEIGDLAARGYTAQEIWAQLPAGTRPTLRHVYRVLQDVNPPDPSGPWSLSTADEVEATLVAPVLAEVVDQTEGRRRSLTKREAAVVANIRRAVPDFDQLFYIYILARQYIRAEGGWPTEHIDLLVAGLARWGNSIPWQYFEKAGAEELMAVFRITHDSDDERGLYLPSWPLSEEASK